MTNQAIAGAAVRGEGDAGRITVPVVTIRLAGALLALAVAAVHVADQGSVTGFSSPDWIGWSFRLIEVGGVLTALALLLPRPVPVPAWAGWAAGALLGTGPFVAYILSRSVGVPGDPGDVGNWGYWVGTVSLFIEAGLVMVSVSMLLSLRQSASGGGFRGLIGRAGRGH
jgi:hypothetical protein